MADEMDNQDESPKGGKKLLVVALTVGLIGGAVTGSLVVGPLVAEGPAEEEGHGEASGEGGADCSALLAAHGVSLAPAAVHTIDNVIVNPAQSGGTRFLMASVAFGLTNAAANDQMALRDAEVRDIVVGVLSSKNVGELSDISMRNGIKEEIRGRVVSLVGDNSLVDIYFPQFVIQ